MAAMDPMNVWSSGRPRSASAACVKRLSRITAPVSGSSTRTTAVPALLTISVRRLSMVSSMWTTPSLSVSSKTGEANVTTHAPVSGDW